MLYSQQIKNIVSGVSQQPDILRLPEQLKEQTNGFSTESSGLQKRPPTCYVATLSVDKIDDDVQPLVHFINRDQRERYILYFYGGTINIYDLSGAKKTVHIEGDAEYLATDNPRNDLRIVTIADYTFILNRKIKVLLTDKKSPDSFNTQGALVHVKQGQYGRTYKIWVDDVEVAVHSTPDGSDKSHTTQIDTAYIAGKLADLVRAKGYTVDQGNTWIRIRGVHKVATQDGFNNQAMIGIVNSIQKFSLLPETAPDGFTVKVAGDPNGSGAGSYYVKYSESDHIWKECVAPNLQVEIDPRTMPHSLVRNTDGSFVFKRCAWGERKTGDEDSNPNPSFINQKLNDIFFFRNRLGVLSGENIILSESAEYFNFWMSTANDILDTDCIDIPTTTTRVNILNYAVAFNQALYCFSESTQFLLSADTVLSPKNCALVEVTGFNNSPSCRPVVAGKNLYFPAERAEYTAIKEYYNVQDVGDVKNAQEITSHVNNYIKNGVYRIVANTNENIILCLSDGARDTIYVYKYLFLQEQRVQAAWSKWTFDAHIFGCFFIGSSLYVLLNRGDAHVLERLDLTYDTKDYQDEPYRVYLDAKQQIMGGTYDPIYDVTEYDLSNYYLGRTTYDNGISYVLDNGKYGQIKKDELKDGKIARLTGDFTHRNVIFGFDYPFVAELGAIYLRQEDGRGGYRALTNGRLQIRDLNIQYDRTGAFVVDVTTHNHTYTYTFANRILGQSTFNNPQSLVEGSFRVPVQSLNTAAKITIKSDFPLPLSLIGYTWRGAFIARARGG